MAKYGRTLAEVKVFIDGKEQAKKALEELTAEADKYKKAIADSNKKMQELAKAIKDDPKKVVDYENERKNLAKLEREYKKLKRSISETEKLAADIEKDLDNMSNLSVSKLRALERQLKAVQSNLTPKKDPNGTFIAFLNESIKKVSDAIKSRRGEFVEFESIMAKISHVDDRSLDNVIKRLKELIATTDKLDGDKMIKYTEQLAFAEETKRQRTLQSGEKVITRVEQGVFKGTITETQEAIKLLEEYKKSLKTTDTAGIERVQNAIKQMNAELDEFNKKQARETLTTGLQTSGTADIKQAVDWLTKHQGTLEPLSQEWRDVNAQIEAGNHRLKQLADATKYEAMVKQFSELNYLSTNALTEQKKYWESMRDNAEAGTIAYDEAIAKLKEISTLETDRMKQQSRETLTTGLQTSGTSEIKQAVDWLTKYQGTLEPLSQEWREVNAQIEAGNERLKQLTNQTKLEAITAQFAKLGDLSSNAFAEQKKYWEGIRDSVAESDPLYKQAIDNLKQITDLENTRMKSSARETLTTNLQTSGTAEIKQAVDWLTKYQGTLEPLSQEWREVNAQIEAGNERLKQLSDRTKLESMVAQFGQLSNLSKNALEEQQKYWQSVLDNSSKGTAAYIQAERKLQAVSQEMTDRLDAEKGKVFNNLSNYSVSEIEEAIKATEKLRDAQKAGSVEYGIYNNEIKRAKEYLQSYVDLNKQIDMEGKWANLTTLSAGALAEQKKYWQEMVNGAQNGSQELQEYQNRLQAVTDEESRRSENRLFNVANNPDQYSTSEIEEAVKVFQKLRDEQKIGSQQWQWYADLVDKATEQLSRFKDEAKMKVMADQFANLRDLSVNALAEQKKYWQGVYDSAQAGTAAYDDAFDKLREIRELEESRTKRYAEMDINAALSGNWNRTIEDTEKAIKLIEEYKKQLHVKSDAPAIDEANQAITILNQNLGKAKEALMDVNGAINIGEQLKQGTFDGTTEEILRAKKALEEYRKTLKQKTDAAAIKSVDEALRNVTNSAEQAQKKLVSIEDVLSHLDTASMDDLQSAAKQLQDKLDGATRKTAEYAENAAKLRQVHLELKKVKKEWEGQENVIARTAKRLASYILVYAGWNEVWGQIKQVYQANLELSDSLADIQKTTGLSAESVGHLSDQINAIDTRTAQKELHDLAYEAGKLGISAEEDVLAFAKAGNQLLVALGEDLGGAEAVRQLMKVNAILGETQELGVEKALLSTGSAINEISQTSRASAGPIADMVSRMGAIGSAAGLSMADLIALAGTADSLGQSAEVAATAFNKFIATLTSNPVDVAYALGMDPDQIQKQLETGNTMQVIQDIFAKMGQMGNMADLAPIMGELGSEGARMTQVLVTMAKGVDELNAQVFTSRQAFAEATSVTNEYNIKNESAAAIVQRMGNNIREAFTNSTLVEWIREVLQFLYYIPNALERNRLALLAVRTVLWDIAAVVLVKLVATLKGALVGALGGATMAWKAFYIQAAAAMFGIDKSQIYWRRMTLHCIATTNALGKARIAFLALGKAMLANPIFTIGAVIGGAVAAIQHFSEETSKSVKIQAEFSATVEKEKFELNNLIYAINNANSANGERASLIQELNNKYGQYLGFLVTEENYLRNQTYIYDLLNAQIEKSIALKMQEKLVSDVASTYADQQREAYEDMNSALSEAATIGDTGAAGAMSKLMTAIKEQARAGVKDVNAIFASIGGPEFQEAMKKLTKQYEDGQIDLIKYNKEAASLGRGQFGTVAYNELYRAVSDMLGIETKIAKEVSLATKISKANIDTFTSNVESIKKKETDNILPKISTTENAKELQEYQQKLSSFIQEQKNSIKGLALEREELNSLNFNEEKQLDAINDKLAKKQQLTEEEQRQYDILIKKQNDEMKLSEEKEKQWKAVNDQVKIYDEALKEVDKKLFQIGGQSLWGPNENIADKAPEELAAMYAKLEKDAARLSKASFKNIGEVTKDDGKKYITQFWKNFDTRNQAIEWYKNQKNALAAQLDKLGYTVRGKFKTGDDGSGGRKRPKDEFEAALASLEAYYNDREEIVRKNALFEETTQEELDKRLQSLEQEHLSARIELRKLMLSKENSFLTTFSHAAESEYMQGIDYGKLQTQLGKLGKAMSQGLEKNLTADMVTLQKIAWEHQEKISKILIENDPVKKVALEYQQSFEKIDLFWAADELRTKEAANEKMATLLEFSAKRADLNDEDMRSQLEASKQFGNVVKTMTAEEYQAFLVLLDQYAEAATNAKRQATQKAIKNLEFGFDNSELGKQVSGQLKNLEEMETQFGNLDSSGLVLEATSFKKHKEFVEQRIALEQIKWNEMIETEKNGMNRSEVLQELMLERDKATYEARLEVMKLIMDMDANMFEESNSRIDQMQGWGAISEIDATERQRSLIYAELGLKQMRIDELIRIEEEGQNRMDVINNLRLAKQDALYKADRRLTELTMQEYQQRAQVAQEWGSAIGTGLGEMIGGTEDAGKTLVKNLATMAVQSIGQMAQMYVAKQLLLSQQNMSEAAAAMTTATTAAAEATAVGAAKTAEATAIAMATPDSVLTGGAAGAAKAAVISGLIAAAVAASIAIINSLFPGAGSKATASNRKLSTGMLTYAEGNYPVLGNDGKVYDAKYEGAGMKTGIYGGGAHFGIFSEKQPELIVDGKTTQKLVLNYPYIYDAITTIAKNGRLVNAMPTFASGDYPAGMNRIAQVEAVDISGGSNEQMDRMSAALEQSQEVNRQLLKLLQGGITAHLDGLETHRQQKKNERFLKRRGID